MDSHRQESLTLASPNYCLFTLHSHRDSFVGNKWVFLFWLLFFFKWKDLPTLIIVFLLHLALELIKDERYAVECNPPALKEVKLNFHPRWFLFYSDLPMRSPKPFGKSEDTENKVHQAIIHPIQTPVQVVHFPQCSSVLRQHAAQQEHSSSPTKGTSLPPRSTEPPLGMRYIRAIPFPQAVELMDCSPLGE